MRAGDPVAGKGLATAPYVVEMFLHDLGACGLGPARIVTKTDQEPAIFEVRAEISRPRREIVTDGTAEESSGVGDSSSNGRIERAMELQGRVRTMKVALEERPKQRISIVHPLAPWLVRHAATTSNNYTIR